MVGVFCGGCGVLWRWWWCFVMVGVFCGGCSGDLCRWCGCGGCFVVVVVVFREGCSGGDLGWWRLWW